MADIDDNMGDFGDLVSIELFQALADSLNSLIDSVPVGEISTIMLFPGFTSPPDPTIWQECNGSQITEQLSPLRGQFTDDLRDRYLKGALSLSQVGILGGSNSQNFSHNHTGQTQGSSPPTSQIIVDASDGFWESSPDHSHSIPSSLGTTNMEPRHFMIKHYLKIR